MSVSKWAYEPDVCDGEPCVGDCDRCKLADEAEEYRAELEEMEDPQQPSYRERNSFDGWRNGSVAGFNRANQMRNNAARNFR